MNLYKRKIYKKSLQHGQKWRDHKYLYIDANGNYVYPEDVKNSGPKRTISGSVNANRRAYNYKAKIAGQKTEEDIRSRTKNMKFDGDHTRRVNEHLREVNRIQQVRSAHQGSVFQTGSAGARHKWSDGTIRDTNEVNPTHVSKGLKPNNNISVGSSRKIEGNKSAFEKERKKQQGVLEWAPDPLNPGREKGYAADTPNLARSLYRSDKRKAEAKRKEKVDATIEEMRKRKKRMDASVEPVKPTRNISGVKPGGKAPVKETPTSEKKRRSIDRDDLRTYKKAAGMMLDEGRQNEINRRKERSERTKAGNAKMAKEINSDNAKKVGKAILYNSKLGKLVKAGELMDDNRKLKKRKASR